MPRSKRFKSICYRDQQKKQCYNQPQGIKGILILISIDKNHKNTSVNRASSYLPICRAEWCPGKYIFSLERLSGFCEKMTKAKISAIA